LTKDLKLLRPKFKNILKGTTMNRALQLAEKLIPEGLIHHIGEADLVEADIQNAKEAFMIGTTLDVLPAISYEAQAIGDGKVGPVAKRLLQLLREDQL